MKEILQHKCSAKLKSQYWHSSSKCMTYFNDLDLDVKTGQLYPGPDLLTSGLRSRYYNEKGSCNNINSSVQDLEEGYQGYSLL